MTVTNEQVALAMRYTKPLNFSRGSRSPASTCGFTNETRAIGHRHTSPGRGVRADSSAKERQMETGQIKLTREMKRRALATARMDDWGDPWGTGMGHMFAVADIVYHAEGSTPPEWYYHHGQFICDPIANYAIHAAEEDHTDCDCIWPDVEYVPFLDAGPLGVAMLTYAGDVLNRYLGFVKRAGRDY